MSFKSAVDYDQKLPSKFGISSIRSPEVAKAVADKLRGRTQTEFERNAHKASSEKLHNKTIIDDNGIQYTGTYKSIAKQLNVSTDTVKDRIKKGVWQLMTDNQYSNNRKSIIYKLIVVETGTEYIDTLSNIALFLKVDPRTVKLRAKKGVYTLQSVGKK